MGLHVAGKNLDIGDALRGRVETRVGELVAKYFEGGYNGQVVVEREGSGFRTEVTLHLDSGATLHAEADAMEAPLAFDRAAERVEKRLRRYKRKLRDRHAPRAEAIDATAYVLAAPADVEEPEIPDNPVVIAEQVTALRTLTVGAAVMALDLTDQPLLLFRHATSGAINVVYRRRDGNIGWIDPSAAPRQG